MHRNIQTPAARANDPSTSHAAADAMTRSGWRRHHQEIVSAAVHLSPGSTSAELAEYCERHAERVARYAFHTPCASQEQAVACILDRVQIARRLPEAETADEVRRGEARKCAIKGRKSLTWWPVSKEVRHDG